MLLPTQSPSSAVIWWGTDFQKTSSTGSPVWCERTALAIKIGIRNPLATQAGNAAQFYGRPKCNLLSGFPKVYRCQLSRSSEFRSVSRATGPIQGSLQSFSDAVTGLVLNLRYLPMCSQFIPPFFTCSGRLDRKVLSCSQTKNLFRESGPIPSIGSDAD